MSVSDRAPLILVGILLPTAIATAFVLARVYARIRILRQWGLDDTLLVLGWVAACTICIIESVGTHYGVGKHESDLSLADLKIAGKLEYAALPVYTLGLSLTKLSIAVFYLRIFNATRAAIIQNYAIIAYIVVYTIPLVVRSIVICVPLSKAFSYKPDTPGYCLNNQALLWAAWALNVLCDIWLILFAGRKVWYLKMDIKKKSGLLLTLTVGWVVVVVATLRAVRIGVKFDEDDITWQAYDWWVWGTVEADVALICASTPSLHAIFVRIQQSRYMSPLANKPSQGQGKVVTGASSRPSQNAETSTTDTGRSRASRPELMWQDSQELLTYGGEQTQRIASSSDDDGEATDCHDGDTIRKSTRVSVSRVELFKEPDLSIGV